MPPAPGTSCGGSRFTPIPTTTYRTAASATLDSSRTPPTFVSWRIRSFGHLQVTRRPVVARIALAISAPASNDSNPVRAGASCGRRTKEKSKLPSGTSDQARPSRPFPSVWCAVATSVHSGSPASANATAVAFVEGVTSSDRTGAVTVIAARTSTRSSRVSTSGSSREGVVDEAAGENDTRVTKTPTKRPKLLVANRGEIAVRIMRTCREIGIPTVAVYSDADRDALHVEMADQSYRLGPALASDSYLSIGAILEAAQKSRSTLIHPGYGFLAERAHFAKAVEEAGFTFVGPPPAAIERMGDKAAARRIADAADVPIIPGTREPVDVAMARKEAPRIGFPLLVKAAFGGGGKGMHIVRDADRLEESLNRAAREAKSDFGRSEVFLERYVEHARHREAQIVADTKGNVVFLGERDCSVQRRHQKLG